MSQSRTAGTGSGFLSAFFGHRLTEVDAPDYSHAIRWRNTARTQRFFSGPMLAAIADARRTEPAEVEYPADFGSWGPLERSQYLEAAIKTADLLARVQAGGKLEQNSGHPGIEIALVKLAQRLLEFEKPLDSAMAAIF